MIIYGTEKLLKDSSCSLPVKLFDTVFADISTDDKNNEPFIVDRFGILADTAIYKLPQYDDSNIIEAMRSKAKSYGKLSIGWSGGVDSTAVIACCVDAGVDFTVITDPYMSPVSPSLNYYVRKNFNVIDRWFNLFPKDIVLGTCADTQFFPDQRLKQEVMEIIKDKKIENGQNFFENLLHELKFSTEEIGLVLNYTKTLGRPVYDAESMARFIYFTVGYEKQKYIAMDERNFDSFFSSQKFTNITWTSYWDANRDVTVKKKKILKQYIAKIFGSTYGVETNGLFAYWRDKCI